MADQLLKMLQSVTADQFNKVVLASVALISVIVSPLLQWWIARRQATLQERIARRQAADNISAKRQVWIDELRKDVAEYLTLFARLEDLRRPTPGLGDEDQRLNFDETSDASKRATELGIRIKLRLNPNEDEHNEFVRLLGVLSDACADAPPGETPEQMRHARERFAQARDGVISHLQTILKHEWERVKKGDI
ncbi:hypothetical protein C5615_35930 [Burkholderia cepacia]|uniref:Uncharacterized protein n=1 Tax=Burkholderia cepacia TaxID=292 RepID=A0A2S8I238_BURCE|nr:MULTISPECIES: hypothetical protein [Burkholderia cepacia complex]PQP08745.1 hypothetical protein C5615_35930 [Burkholderia cepacia]TDA45933.1 hypothetical protein EVG18_18810 [Burkholderia pyrrocinia]HDR9511702.1 hypothetical protein [Burkholderia cepacia]